MADKEPGRATYAAATTIGGNVMTYAPLLPPQPPPPPPPLPTPPQTHGLRNCLLMIGAGLVVIGVVSTGGKSSGGGSNAGGSSGGGSNGAPTTPHVAPSIQQQITDWWAVVKPDFEAVTADQDAISTAAGNSDIPALAAACGQLQQDVQTVQADAGSPDPLEQQYLASAMDSYSTAASSCLAGDFTSATQSITDGTSFIDQASARIRALTPGG